MFLTVEVTGFRTVGANKTTTLYRRDAFARGTTSDRLKETAMPVVNLELSRSNIRHSTCSAQTFARVIDSITVPAHHIDLGCENRLVPLAFDPIPMIGD